MSVNILNANRKIYIIAAVRRPTEGGRGQNAVLLYLEMLDYLMIG